MTDARALAQHFEEERPRLTAMAARLLSSHAEAEDAVQETWLRLSRADTALIENIDAWLTTVLSRVCLDQLRSPRRSRERSWEAAPWSEEPISGRGDPAAEAEAGDRIAAALLVVLDQLSPAERIAFVLHDVFGRPFDEVAAALDRSPQAARQLASRARRRLHGSPDGGRSDVRRARPLVDAWLAAAQQGDVRRLLDLLDDDAVLDADYGTSRQHLAGAQEIAAQAVIAARLAAHSTPVLLGGRPGVAAVIGGRVVSVMAFEIAGDRIVRLDVLADPARLARLDIAGALGLH
ncbi:sigma-70 family RNA polymerase sigma factor [Leifsonia shinshuensis]|uniref:sigma-70 family RNA polymerase sigma factor n=1 Tax=Leifsonia shinshuensis TaxID=150026 RepID=UPI0028583DC8|nr:sigma-70 family RNA polymerase sigma factor [Leifsonia shinshuensis]MDR6973055.1 RNA polymerase sigma-70 factor (ECF subfamily) [Leifsonia shinshuensis]